MLLLCFETGMAQNLLPSVYNYKLSEYQGASKNWGLAVNSRGELFAANNKGLLHYDGEKWTLNKLPNNTIIRSVGIFGDRVFTGSYEEFGYWTKDDLGALKYTSLTYLIENHEFTSEEFWEIIPFGEQVIFRSFSTIYIYQNNKIKVIDLPQIISDLVIHNSSIIVAAGTEGLFELKNDTLSPLTNQGALLDKNLTDMVSLGNQLLIGTKLDGCYLMGDQGLMVWDTALNQELKRHQLNKILKFNDSQLAFGTIKNGVYLWDTTTETSKLLNREAGLLNNTVLSM
ncbi:MAG: Two component regulator three Y domain-containing protein, partial [Bacteroidota bacterium]